MSNAVYENLVIALWAGERKVVGSAFLDWLTTNDGRLAKHLCTIRNPDRVGILDAFVAYIDVEKIIRLHDEAFDLVSLCLPDIEDLESEAALKPGVMKKLTKRMRTFIENYPLPPAKGLPS